MLIMSCLVFAFLGFVVSSVCLSRVYDGTGVGELVADVTSFFLARKRAGIFKMKFFLVTTLLGSMSNTGQTNTRHDKP